MKHRCKEMAQLPKSTQIEFDIHWGWCWTTPNVMETVTHCCYCGAKLDNASDKEQRSDAKP